MSETLELFLLQFTTVLIHLAFLKTLLVSDDVIFLATYRKKKKIGKFSFVV